MVRGLSLPITLYVMAQLAPGYNYEVTKITTVLGVDNECRFRIDVVAKKMI